MNLLPDYHELISNLIFIFFFFSLLVRLYLFGSFIIGDLQHWLCLGGDLETNYWSILFISSLLLKAAWAALERMSETAHSEHVIEGETEQNVILHHVAKRRGQSAHEEMPKQLHNLLQGYRWVWFRSVRKQLLRNWGSTENRRRLQGSVGGRWLLVRQDRCSTWAKQKEDGPCCFG